MELSDQALEQMKHDLDDLVRRSNEREVKASRLQGQYDIIKRVLIPIGQIDIATIELTRITEESKELLRQKDEANLQLDTIKMMLDDHHAARTGEKNAPNPDTTESD